jgi:hypothetical protein
MCGHEGAEGSCPEHVHHEEDSYEVEALRSHRLGEVHRDCSANSLVVEHRTLEVGDDIPSKPTNQGDDSDVPEVRLGCGRLACALQGVIVDDPWKVEAYQIWSGLTK